MKLNPVCMVFDAGSSAWRMTLKAVFNVRRHLFFLTISDGYLYPSAITYERCTGIRAILSVRPGTKEIR